MAKINDNDLNIQYTPNSNKYKTEVSEKRVESVVTDTTKIKTRKRGLASKFASAFFSEDIKTIKDWVVMDVIIPSIKDAISNTVDMILFGSTHNRKPQGQYGNASYVSYNNYYNKPRQQTAARNDEIDYQEIIYPTRGDAEGVLGSMCDLIVDYGSVSIADLYDLVGKAQYSNHTDNKYGWRDLSSASVKRVREGYILSLPRVIQLD